MDLYLENETVLHVMDTTSRLSHGATVQINSKNEAVKLIEGYGYLDMATLQPLSMISNLKMKSLRPS